ncbi:MAG: hypothetical protein ACOC42_04060 [Halobacteriota archaeon]
MRVKREHLTLLFNRLFDRGDARFSISHPCEAIGDLVRVELDEPESSSVRFEVDRDGYAVARNEAVLRHGDTIETDLPAPDDYRNAIVASGIVEPVNIDALSTFLTRYGDPDLMAGHAPVFAGFDTNLLPWRIDRILGLRDPESGVGYVNGFALATGVRDELDWDVKCHDTDPFVDAYGPAAEAYWNQPIGSGRISRLGLTAYREIRDIQQAAELASDRGDEAIIGAYADWQDDVRGQVILFSNDRGFVERARANTILSHVVELPTDWPTTMRASWRELELLVYLLTVVFGIVELPGVTLHGVWRGKEGVDWQEERVKLDARSPPLRDALEGDLSIVESYEELRQR